MLIALLLFAAAFGALRLGKCNPILVMVLCGVGNLLVGLILYLVWKDTMPLRAKSCGKGAIIGVIFYVVFVILMVVIAFVAIPPEYWDYYYYYSY